MFIVLNVNHVLRSDFTLYAISARLSSGRSNGYDRKAAFKGWRSHYSSSKEKDWSATTRDEAL